MRRAIVLLVGILLASSVPGGFASAAPAPPSASRGEANTATADYCADSEELAVLQLINNYRAQNGRGALVLTQTLSAAADHHSVDMATRNYFSHTLLDGTSWWQNITNHGYPYTNLRGENIAAGYASASSAFAQWRNSPAHNTNMLNPNYRAIGIGRAYNAGATYDWYWTTTLGGGVDGAAAVCSGPPPTSTPPPVGGGKLPILGSGRTSNSNTSLYAYDGQAATAWNTTSTSAPFAAYVFFDFGSAKTIQTVRWMFAVSGNADSWRLQVSNDKTTWTTLTTQGNAPASTWQSLSVSASARYVRFYFTNPNGDLTLGSLAEVEFYG